MPLQIQPSSTTATGPVTDTQSQPVDTSDKERLFDFQKAKINLKAMIDIWSLEVWNTEQNRALRLLDVDPNLLESRGKIDSDETVITIRTIDTNIKREQPTYIGYLQQSRRVATFTDIANPENDCQKLEDVYARGMTYPGWLTPLTRTIDGTQVHGWDSVEVVFDPSKPLNYSLEHIGHEMLIVPIDTRDIQTLESVIRVYNVTQPKLREFVTKYGFSKSQIDELLSVYTDQRKNETVTIYKQFFRFEGVVYVAWFELSRSSDWLKPPMKHYMGLRQQVQGTETQFRPSPLTGAVQPVEVPSTSWQDVDETKFPVMLLVYDEQEDERLLTHKGRVFRDKSKQEALTALASSVVNGCNKASQVFASPKTGSGGRPAIQEDIKLFGGRLFSEPIDFWNHPYPDPLILTTFQAFDVYNSQEVGQVNYAAQNRADSRKTATEIQAANQEQSLLKSVQMTLFSAFIRDIHVFVWAHVASQALQGKIKIFQGWDPQIFMRAYDIRAAGDVDVVQRLEKVNRMKQDWPVISQTPLALPFLLDLIKLEYPAEYPRYAALMQSQDPNRKQWMAAALQVMPALISQEEAQQMPQEVQQVGQLIQQGQQLVQAP